MSSSPAHAIATSHDLIAGLHAPHRFAYERVIEDISEMDWRSLSRDELTRVAWVYYYFSVQFRENLEIARSLFPDDPQLERLDRGERDTDNLSPWPGVAEAGERMNHDEFMRRLLLLSPIPEQIRRRLESIGQAYLELVRGMNQTTRALSLASYEDGGLESVFGAMLKAQDWDSPLLGAFRHFLEEHIRFDSDPDQGHGALCRHLAPDDSILPLWVAFHNLLATATKAKSG